MKLAINLKSALLLIVFISLIFSVIVKCTEKSSFNFESLNRYSDNEKKEEKDKKAEVAEAAKKPETNKKQEPVKKEIKKTETKKKAQKQTKESAKELAKAYIYFAKLPYCEEQKTCEACKEIRSKGFQLIASEKAKSGAVQISMTINRNVEKKETVISFAGPKSNDINFIQSIYIKGFSAEAYKALKAPVETVFWDGYTAIKPKLIKQITEILLSSEEENILFVGHSFGGSLAILAAYDLKKTNIINKTHKPKVITFAALKIGNFGFLKRLHTLIPIGVIRLRSIFDLYTFIPRCVFIPSLNVFHCYTSYLNLLRVWPIFARYIYTYYPIIRSKIAWAAPGVVKNFGPKPFATQRPLKALHAKSVLSEKHTKEQNSRNLFHKKSHKALEKVFNNKVNASHSSKLSHFEKLLKNGKVNKSNMAVKAGIKRSTELSLLSKINKSSGMFKKLMNKSVGTSKELKPKKVNVKRINKFVKKVIKNNYVLNV